MTANGGNIYKHVHGIYSRERPSDPFSSESVQDEINALPSRTCLAEFNGEATIEAYTVMYNGFEPSIAHVALRTPDDERTWVNTEDKDTVRAMTEEEFCGRHVQTSTASDTLQVY